MYGTGVTEIELGAAKRSGVNVREVCSSVITGNTLLALPNIDYAITNFTGAETISYSA